jgi:acyl-CoA hydrolase
VAAATVYTAPAQTKAVIRQIQIVNNAGTDQLVTISVGADAAAKRIWRRNCVANEVDGMTCNIPVEAGEIIQAFAGSTSVTLTISGVEIGP